MKRTAVKAAKEAGKILLQKFNSLKAGDVHFKDKHEIVTTEDYRAEKRIIKILKTKFPCHSILSEEGGGKKCKSDYLWVLDPLDGTTNYYIGNPLFSVSISLFHKKEVILGVIYAPITKELFVVEKNRGAFLNNKKIHIKTIANTGIFL